MIYLKRTNVSGRHDRTKAAFIVSLLILAFTVHLVFPTFYARLLTPIASFIWTSTGSVGNGLGNMAGLVRSKYSLLQENAALKEEVRSRDVQATLLKDSVAKNNALQALLGRGSVAKGFKDVLAVVLSRPPLSAYDTVIIDIGAKDGVKMGDKVYVDGTVLIGDVAEVLSGTSKVSLFSTPGREMQVQVGTSKTAVIATGRGAGNFILTMPVENGIQVGDSVVLPQLREHVFGTVAHVSADASDSLQTILFKTPLNINELHYVQVETAVK